MTDKSLISTRGLSRRRALQAGIVGGTALWVAPTVESLYTPAAAASNTGPCAGAAQTIDWSTFPTNGAPGAGGFPYTVGTFGGTIVTFELIAAGSLVWGTGESGVQTAAQSGNFTGIFQLYKNLAPIGDTTVLRIRFNKVVKNLSFRITDIDLANTGGNNFVDQVKVEPFLNGVAQSGTFTPDTVPNPPCGGFFQPACTAPSFTPNSASTGTTTTRTGTAPAASNSATGNLRVQQTAGVDRVDLTYISNQPSGTGTTQAIGITNISWSC